jgi:hypothetical protein
MAKRIRIRGQISQIVVCAVMSWCVVLQATSAAAQCVTIEGPKQVPVPPLERLTVEAASRALQKAGLKLGTVNPADGKGVVFRQSLDSNRCVPIGTVVDIWIQNTASEPATTVEVPDLRGKSPLEAAVVLLARGLRPGGSLTEQSNAVAPGKIVNQQPEAGTRVPKGTAVVVTVAAESTASPPRRTPALQETLTLKSNLHGPAIPRELVTFVATAEGSARSIQYQFDFGDGQKTPPSNSSQAQHVYRQDGNYTATVTAILDGGVSQVTASTDVSVHDAPQIVTLDVSPRPVNEKQPVTFTAHVHPPEPTPLRYTFHFGDKGGEVSGTPSVTYVYQRNGVYQPVVTILTAHQHKVSSEPIAVIVVPVPPSAWMIVLAVAGVIASATLVGVITYKVVQMGVTLRISSNLRPRGVTVRLQASHEGIDEDEFQFHTDHSPGVIVVADRASLVHSVEVRK